MGHVSFYVETYGCQMNVSDSEVVTSILKSNGYTYESTLELADAIIINTCSIRDKAEQTLFNRLHMVQHIKKKGAVIGILGCMAERLKEKLFEHDCVSFIVGPDEYKSLPDIVYDALKGEKVIKIELSTAEAYNDIIPEYTKGVSAFISITRGCNNMCSYCVVPFTRGRERSKDIKSILRELDCLVERGFKEVTLLGQNVNSYNYSDTNDQYNFARLLEIMSERAPYIRIRFLSSHPKDITEELLHVIKKHKNICKNIQLPCQSGSNHMLRLMNRHYTREEYIEKINMIWSILGNNCSIMTDIIAGFCDETEEDHKDTLSLMDYVKFDYAFTFAYSQRSGTLSANKMQDNVPYDVKIKRLNEIIDLQQNHSLHRYSACVGKTYEVLVEGPSKRNINEWQGRTDDNKVVVFDNTECLAKPGDLINIKVCRSTSATLIGNVENGL